MKIEILTLALVSALSGLPAIAQAPPGAQQPSPEQRAAQAQARAQAALEAAKAPAVEDFKPSTLNQTNRQYPQVNSQRRVRARVVAPGAQSVLLDLGGVRYPLTKGEDGAWVGVSAPQDEGFHYYQINIDGAQVPDPGSLYFYRLEPLGERVGGPRPRPGLLCPQRAAWAVAADVVLLQGR